MTRTRGSSSFAEKAQHVRLFLFDVDGVLTDGTVLIHADGTESKHFHIKDGTGFVHAHKEGFATGLISARYSASTAHRAAQLNIKIVHQGVADKLATYLAIRDEHQLTDAAIAYMGDDLVDLPILDRVGLAAAPSDAVADVLEAVDFVSTLAGGRGAARDLIEHIMRAQARWPTRAAAL